MLTFKVEPWEGFWEESEALRRAHFDEVVQEELDYLPNESLYETEWNAGRLLILSVRSESKMVGYMSWHMIPHPMSMETLVGYEDTLYLSPEFRKGWVGVKFCEAALGVLAGLGVKVVYMNSRSARPLDKLMHRLKLKKVGEMFSKEL